MVWLLGQRPTIQSLEYCVQGHPGTRKKICRWDSHKVSKTSSHTLVSTRDHPPWTSVHQRPSPMEEVLSSHGNGKAKTGHVSWHPSSLTCSGTMSSCVQHHGAGLHSKTPPSPWRIYYCCGSVPNLKAAKTGVVHHGNGAGPGGGHRASGQQADSSGIDSSSSGLAWTCISTHGFAFPPLQDLSQHHCPKVQSRVPRHPKLLRSEPRPWDPAILEQPTPLTR